MKLSIITVNYNVKYFLEHCLNSVLKAIEKLECFEIFVVDNNSVDGSVEMIKEKFPSVQLIINKENKGFSAANNQAIKRASGEYLLLLNPDTVVEEDTLLKITKFMDSHPDAGGLGVKMIDGKGRYLPESKRGLPTPLVAFYKMSGLSKLFPKSKIFNKYHLGFLDNTSTHKVEILSGAFMLLRKTALDKTGLLDESFFMYGEDIDLSYRLILAGYNNYYYPETCIIHYKGESARKGSLNYVFMFYNAMSIFAKKHFSPNNAKVFSLLIKFAIYIKAGSALLFTILIKLFLPMADALSIFGGTVLIKRFWEHYIKFSDGGNYPPEFITFVVPSYIGIWLLSIYLNGGYDKPASYLKITRGIITGTLLILVLYALIPESLRFSRALILLGALWAVFAVSFIRAIFKQLKTTALVGDDNKRKKIIIIGNYPEATRVSDLLKQFLSKPNLVGWVGVEADTGANHEGCLGELPQIQDIVRVHNADEIIFCAKNLPSGQIISLMALLGSKNLDYKIAPPESFHIVGSNSINTAGDLYIINMDAITKEKNKRNKRLFDVAASTLFLFLYPILFFVVSKPLHFLKNIFFVSLGKWSWVGYVKCDYQTLQSLPTIKPGILHPADLLKITALSPEDFFNINMVYAKDYKIVNDLKIIWFGLRNLGSEVKMINATKADWLSAKG